MADSNTPNVSALLMTTGEDSGVWGINLNINTSIFDSREGGRVTVNCAGSADITVTSAQAQNRLHTLTGILTGNIHYILPSQGGLYIINNITTGSFTVTVHNGGTGVVVPQGTFATLFSNPDIPIVTLANTYFNGITVTGGLTVTSGLTVDNITVSGTTSFAAGSIAGAAIANLGINTAQLASGAVTEANQTLADNTTNNVTSSAHGYAPKSPNDATKFLNGANPPAYAVPSFSAPIYFSAIAGLIPTNIAGNSTTATLTVSAGQATDSTNTTLMSGGSYSWAVSNGNAALGYQGGTTLPNNSTIHFFLINGASGTTVFGSTSENAPTLPTGYTVFRRIFSVNTGGTGAPVPYTADETEGSSLTCWLSTPAQDINTTVGTTRTAFPLTVPSGIKVQALYRLVQNNNNSAGVIITSGSEPDTAPAATVVGSSSPFCDSQFIASNQTMVTPVRDGLVITDTSKNINVRSASVTTSIGLVTRGFKDFRRG